MDPLRSLQETLETYLAAIGAQKQPEPPPLLPSMRALEAWEKQWASQADPMLRHYLQRRSYAKALALLKGEEAEGHS
ncbi:MAG: hypothetical protein PW734_06415 [Verrucomicrobium sp.]|nr:hypothetical protein [Verrucomicrobium sp.]